MTTRRPRILFVAEAVTLAHVARPMTLARRLDPSQFDVSIATAPRYDMLFADVDLPRHTITCTSPEVFLGRLAKGSPLFDAATLCEHVREDLDLLERVKPDLVIGDLRLSLAVSARIAKTPFATITNAYWSPYAVVGTAGLRFQVPEIAMTRLLGPGLAQMIFDMVRPIAFALHCRPMHRTRKAFGLSRRMEKDVRLVYSDADYVLYADAPPVAAGGGIAMHPLPDTHHFVGPLPWAPAVPQPAWWGPLMAQPRRKVYVTLGSSGRVDLLPMVLEACAPLDVTVLAATAGRLDVGQAPANARVADYLPGDAAAAAASLVVCNGGSPTTQQAIAAGKPIFALPSNMDQFLNMQGLVRAGAGLVLRPSQASVPAIRQIVKSMLSQAHHTQAATSIQALQHRSCRGIDFEAIVRIMLGGHASQSVNQPMQNNAA